MRQLPWPVTGSLASSLPSTMTTSEHSLHDKLAFGLLWHICACLTFHPNISSDFHAYRGQLASSTERKNCARCFRPVMHACSAYHVSWIEGQQYP